MTRVAETIAPVRLRKNCAIAHGTGQVQVGS